MPLVSIPGSTAVGRVCLRSTLAYNITASLRKSDPLPGFANRVTHLTFMADFHMLSILKTMFPVGLNEPVPRTTRKAISYPLKLP